MHFLGDIPHFTSIDDVSDPAGLVQYAIDLKNQKHPPSGYRGIKMALVFMNPSLRTRLSTECAAVDLGIHVVSLQQQDAWTVELEDHVTMDMDKAEHIKEYARVLSAYVDIVGIRSFTTFEHQSIDYSDPYINALKKYCTVPVINLESCIRHPLQSLADMMTIKEQQAHKKLKIAVSWAPHPKILPQAVTNSFLEWSSVLDAEIHLAHPPEFSLDPAFSKYADTIHHTQEDALAHADFIYVKNWSSVTNYGARSDHYDDWTITQHTLRNSTSAKVMHCLPVRRNVVIADDVMDSAQNITISQVQNRYWAAYAVLHQIVHAL